MNAKRTSIVRVPLVAGLAASSGLLLSLVGTFNCSKYPTYRDVSTDCTAVDSEYELFDKAQDPRSSDPRYDLTLLDDKVTGWYGSADYTPDGGAVDRYTASASTPVAQNIVDGPLCGRYGQAAVFRASHNNDWGGVFGNYAFGNQLRNASEWEGLAFWARSPGPTSKAFTFSLDDENTSSEVVGIDGGATPIHSNCTSYSSDAGAIGQTSGQSGGYDPSTGTPLSGSGTSRAPYQNECGNSYTVRVQVTGDWAFYAIPFNDFQQDLKPNRVPNSVFSAGSVPGTGLLTSALRYIGLRAPKESEVELWIARMAFYQKKK